MNKFFYFYFKCPSEQSLICRDFFPDLQQSVKFFCVFIIMTFLLSPPDRSEMDLAA